MEERIDKIREDLSQLTKQEYEKHGYEAIKTSAKILKEKDDKDTEQEINNLKYKVNQMAQKKEQKKKSGNINLTPIIEKEFMDNTLDMFNIVNNEKEYLEWRKVEMEEKLKILDEYFDEIGDIDDNIKQELIDLVKNGEILYKKDIIYDKINRKILKINLLKKVNDVYILKEDVKKVSIRKKNQTGINKLLKK